MRQTHYWDAIVGDNWPAIAPGQWGALETRLREATADIGVDGLEYARRDFEQRVRASAALQSFKDGMVAHQADSNALIDASAAAADLLRDFADLSHRTRNRILDIVDDADRAIAGLARDSRADRARIARIHDIVSAAREEVSAAVSGAVHTIGPSWNRVHAQLTALPAAQHLPGPTPADAVAYPAAAPQHMPDSGFPGPVALSAVGPQPPQHSGPAGPITNSPVVTYRNAGDGLLAAPHHISDADPLDAGTIRPAATHSGTIPPSADPEPGAGDAATTLAASGTAAWMPRGAGVVQAISRTHEDLFPADAPPPGTAHDAAPDSAQGGDSGPSDTLDDHGASDSPVPVLDTPAADRQSPAHRPDPIAMAPGDAAGPLDGRQWPGGDADPAGMPISSAGSEWGDAPGVQYAASEGQDPGQTPLPVMFMPQAPVAGTTAAAAAARNGDAGDEFSTYTRAVDRATADRPGEAGLPGDTGDSGAGERGITVERARDYRPGSADETGGAGSGSLLRSVVGSAMASEAAPTFEVGGQRVDGYLVLARTILGGILAAVESSWYGVGFAVGVLRRPGGGVTAIVTSNEGRGWLPSGLYLPREISVPWQWTGSKRTEWEGISDPARMLAEFALARESRSDARMAALVSSESIDAGMRGRLGEIALEGRVPASAAMPLGAPGPGLVDRLGLVISPSKQARLDRIPAVAIAPRCTDLAWDAHERIARLGAGITEALGAPALRQRVLDALRRGHEVRADWWEELRDIDDLLAATILTKRVDVSRIPLGELRSGRPGAEASALRAMVAQRRGNELTLLLEGAPDRRMLRDAVYVHGQLAAHLDIDVRRATTVPIGGEKTQ